jgi:peptidylprolyl isomerase
VKPRLRQLLREQRQQSLINDYLAKLAPSGSVSIDAAKQEVGDRIVASTYLNSVTQVPASYPTDAEVGEAYERAKPNLTIPASYRVAQIFLAIPPNADASAIEAVRTEASKLAAQAKQGDFAELARAHSQDVRSAASGGDVGEVALALMIPEIREPVTHLQVGQVSEPVQSPAGFHILKLMSIQAARLATLDEVKPRLRQLLREQRQQSLINDYLAKLAPSGSVSIDSAALDNLLLKVK